MLPSKLVKGHFIYVVLLYISQTRICADTIPEGARNLGISDVKTVNQSGIGETNTSARTNESINANEIHLQIPHIDEDYPDSLDEDRITGGEKANEGDFPFMVGILRDAYPKFIYSRFPVVTWWETDKVYCGGTLLTLNQVLTACHCLIKEGPVTIPNRSFVISPAKITVVAGTTDLNPNLQKGVIRGSRQLHIHPGCFLNETLLVYDYGVITLQKSYTLKTERIEPIGLLFPLYEDSEKINRMSKKRRRCSTMGWGANDNSFPTALRKIEKTLILETAAVCEQKLYNFTYQNELGPDLFSNQTQICTMSDPRINDHTCRGDSGGPLLCGRMNLLTGITSFGSSCWSPDSPMVFARVDILRNDHWFKSTVHFPGDSHLPGLSTGCQNLAHPVAVVFTLLSVRIKLCLSYLRF